MDASSIQSEDAKSPCTSEKPSRSNSANDVTLEAGFKTTASPLRNEVGRGGVGQTKRLLKARHISFIGFGSGIGTGLLIGTGNALANAGPLGLLLAFSLTGLILWAVMISIGELTTLIPTAGSFPHLANRFVDPSVGFTLGITYFYTYASSVAAELSAAAVIVSFWTDVTPVVTITVGLFAIIALNFLGVRFYGEVEVVTASIKVLLFVGLIILGIVLDLGGGPTHDRIGFRNWTDGVFATVPPFTGALSNFLAFFSSFISASYAYQGVECIALAAGETANPSKIIPKAIGRVVYRILFFYVGGVIVIGLLVSKDDPRLLLASGSSASSPFVIAVQQAAIPALPSIINACILTSAWSAGNSFLYVSSRTLLGMAIDGQAPKIFTRVNRQGVPYYAVAFSSLFGFLAYLSLGSGGAGQTFYWLLNMSTIGGLFAWGTLCFAFIRFHKACRVQNVDRSEFAYRSPFQPYAAWFGLIACSIIIIFAGYSVFLAGNWNTSNFFASYVGIPLFFVPLVCWKLWFRTKFQRAESMDLWSGRIDPEDEVEEPIPTTWWGKSLNWLL